MKTSELIGPALDWAVAKCEGRTVEIQPAEGPLPAYWEGEGNSSYWYSTDWAQAGPIIERERINVLAPIVRRIGAERPIFTVDYYRAMICRDENELAIHGRGPTPLVAAMRCYVANKLGEEVDIPKELL